MRDDAVLFRQYQESFIIIATSVIMLSNNIQKKKKEDSSEKEDWLLLARRLLFLSELILPEDGVCKLRRLAESNPITDVVSFSANAQPSFESIARMNAVTHDELLRSMNNLHNSEGPAHGRDVAVIATAYQIVIEMRCSMFQQCFNSFISQQKSNQAIHSELKQTQDIVKESVSVSIAPSYYE